VAETDMGVQGFCYYNTYRPKAAYITTMETTIYIAPTAQRTGVGSLLYAHLIDVARANKLHALSACIGGENPGSIRLHEKFNFRHVGDLKEVGFKFGQWQDTHYYQLLL
jgi:L-amino acid N-acyltransferase YncA